MTIAVTQNSKNKAEMDTNFVYLRNKSDDIKYQMPCNIYHYAVEADDIYSAQKVSNIFYKVRILVCKMFLFELFLYACLVQSFLYTSIRFYCTFCLKERNKVWN